MVVRWNRTNSKTITPRTDPTVKMSKREKYSCVPPAVRSMRENGAGNDCTCAPKSMGASASRKMSKPSVRITALSAGRDSTGRTSTRSVTAPSARPAANAMTKPSQKGVPCSITKNAMYVVNIAIAPCA